MVILEGIYSGNSVNEHTKDFAVYTGVHLYKQRVLIKGINTQKTEFPLRAFFRMAVVTILGSFAIM